MLGTQETKTINDITIDTLRSMENFYYEKFTGNLNKALGTLIINTRVTHKILHITTTPHNLKAVLYYLQNNSLCLFKELQEITCIDKPNNKFRFTVTYTLYSVKYNTNILVSVQVQINSPLPSITQIYEGANWLEREVLDLFGIFFDQHPDLRRILTDYGFQGYPLRKDFPLTGYIELYYNDNTKRLTYEPVELSQDSRIWWVKQTSSN